MTLQAFQLCCLNSFQMHISLSDANSSKDKNERCRMSAVGHKFNSCLLLNQNWLHSDLVLQERPMSGLINIKTWERAVVGSFKRCSKRSKTVRRRKRVLGKLREGRVNSHPIGLMFFIVSKHEGKWEKNVWKALSGGKYVQTWLKLSWDQKALVC